MSLPPHRLCIVSQSTASEQEATPPSALDTTAPAVDKAVAGSTVSVLLPLPLAEAYDYRLPDGISVAPGMYVLVPLGRREAIGVVWGNGTGEVAADKLRDIAE